jgi:hypothetical protein
MRYIKSVVVGIIAAGVAAVVWVVVVGVLPIAVPFVIGKFFGTGGTASAYITSGTVLVAALVGFVLGFVWRFRRTPALADK